MAPISDSNASYGLDQVASADVLNTSAAYGALTVSTSPVEARVGSSRLANRKSLIIFNNSTVTLYWGFDTGVNANNGMPLLANSYVTISVGQDIPVYLIASSGSRNVRIVEAG